MITFRRIDVVVVLVPLLVFLLVFQLFQFRIGHLQDFVNPNKSSSEQLVSQSHSTTDNNHYDRGDNQNNNTVSRTDRPYLVLHIGPPKTGTTTIQCELARLNEELAKNDSYYYFGIPCLLDGKLRLQNNETYQRGFYILNDLRGKSVNGDYYTNFQERLNYRLERNDNVIFSSEHFNQIHSDEGFQMLKNATEGFHVRVVVSYRRYWEWLPSYYYQANKRKNIKRMEKLVPYLLKHIHDRYNTKHPTMVARDYWIKHFDDVYVFNMHQQNGQDLLTNFVCQAIPDATNTCNKKMHELQQMKNDNDDEASTTNVRTQRRSSSLDFRKLDIVATELGFESTQAQKKLIMKNFEEFQQLPNNNYDTFLSCLTKDEEQALLDKALSFEKDLIDSLSEEQNNLDEKSHNLKHFLTEEGKQEHIKAFFDKKDDLFCEINVTKALLNDTLVNFVFGDGAFDLFFGDS